MVDAIGTSLIGLQNVMKRFEKSATNLATNQAPADPTQDLVDVAVAKNEFEANLKVIKVQDKMTESLLDIIV